MWTTVPDGYNKMDDVEFTITFDKNAAEGEKFSITPEKLLKSNDYFSYYRKRIWFYSSGTGGIGTIYSIPRYSLVLGAGILLVQRQYV